MRLSVLQSNLAKGLSIVGRAVESRPSMPVLSNVLLKTEESRLKLAAVNLSLGLGITVWIGANVEIEGAVTLPAKVFVDLVHNLSNDRVDLTGRRLICSNHGALFRVEDGLCIFGPCHTRSLARVPIRVAEGMIVLDGKIPSPPEPQR